MSAFERQPAVALMADTTHNPHLQRDGDGGGGGGGAVGGRGALPPAGPARDACVRVPRPEPAARAAPGAGPSPVWSELFGMATNFR